MSKDVDIYIKKQPALYSVNMGFAYSETLIKYQNKPISRNISLLKAGIITDCTDKKCLKQNKTPRFIF